MQAGWMFVGNYSLLTLQQSHADSSTAAKRITQGAWNSSTGWEQGEPVCACMSNELPLPFDSLCAETNK